MLRLPQYHLDEDIIESLVEDSIKLKFEEKFTEFDAMRLNYTLVKY